MDDEDALGNVLEVVVDTVIPAEEKNEVVTTNQVEKQMMEVEGYNKNDTSDGIIRMEKACNDDNVNRAEETNENHMEILDVDHVNEFVGDGKADDKDGFKVDYEGVDIVEDFVEAVENIKDGLGDLDEIGKHVKIGEVEEMEKVSRDNNIVGACTRETKENHMEVIEVAVSEIDEDDKADDKDGSREEKSVDNIRDLEYITEDGIGNDNDGVMKENKGVDNIRDLEQDGGNMKDGRTCFKDLDVVGKVEIIEDGVMEMNEDGGNGNTVDTEKSNEEGVGIVDFVKGAEEDMEDVPIKAKDMDEDGKNETIDGVNETDEDNKDVKIDVVKQMDEDIKAEVVGSVEMDKELDGKEGAVSIDKEEMGDEMMTVNGAQDEEKKDEKVKDNSGNDKGVNDAAKAGAEKVEIDRKEERRDEKGDDKDEDEMERKEQELGNNEAVVLETNTGLRDEKSRLVREKSQEDNEDRGNGSKEKNEKDVSKDENVLKKCEEKDFAEKTKQRKGVAENKEKETKTPVASVLERPMRERKTVERLVASIEKDSSSELRILKGHGTPLRDIPNVAYKLARRKANDTLKLLHMILFGRRGKAVQIKNNISRFSGFVWHENEEKQKLKVKEKLDKANKEKLWEICDVLDIPVPKGTRKEDIVVRLFDFLMEPRAMTSTLLAEKEQVSSREKKRKRGNKSGASMSRGTSKSAGKGHGDFDETSEDDSKSGGEMESVEHEDDENDEEYNSGAFPVRSEAQKDVPSECKEEMKKDGEKRNSKKTVSAKKSSNSPAKRTGKNSISKRRKVDDDEEAKPRVFSRKRNNVEGVGKKSSTPAKSVSQEKTGGKRSRSVKGKAKVKGVTMSPSSDELRNAICEILKEVDFNSATFTDILNQLGDVFKSDLSARKAPIKLMIQDELTKLADEADEDDEEGEEE